MNSPAPRLVGMAAFAIACGNLAAEPLRPERDRERAPAAIFDLSASQSKLSDWPGNPNVNNVTVRLAATLTKSLERDWMVRASVNTQYNSGDLTLQDALAPPAFTSLKMMRDRDLDDYARLILRGDTVTATQAPASAGNRRDERRARADQRARLVPLRQQLARIEQRMAEIDKRKRAADAALGDQQLYEATQSARLAELTRQAALLNAESAKLEDEWLQAQHELEQAAAG